MNIKGHTEADLRRALKREFAPLILRHEAVFQPIESALTGTGIPDLFIQRRGKSTWIELKELEVRSARQALHVPFRPNQLRWIKCLLEAGGDAALALLLWNEQGKTLAICVGSQIKEIYANPLELMRCASSFLPIENVRIDQLLVGLNLQ